MNGCRQALCLFPSLSVWPGIGRREEDIDLLTGFHLPAGWWHLESCPSQKWTSFGSKRNSDNGISVGLPCSEGCKTSKMRFGNDRFAVYGIVYNIASVNEFFRKTENYSGGLQIVLLGRWSIPSAIVVWLKFKNKLVLLQIVRRTCVKVGESDLGYFRRFSEHSFADR